MLQFIYFIVSHIMIISQNDAFYATGQIKFPCVAWFYEIIFSLE